MSARLRFLDAARGLAVVAMLLANLVNVFAPVRPRWLGHNLGDELQLFDLPAPVFQLLIGTSLVLFLSRRSQGGSPAAARRLAIRRFVLLIGLGGVLDAVAAGHLEVRWGVLQTLGMGGLVAVAFAGASDALALGVAALILVTHYGPGNNAVHRSALDCLPFLSLTLLGLVIARPLATGDRARFRQRALIAATSCLALAIGLRLAGIPFNKVTGTGSFVALSGAVGSTLLAALETFDAGGLEMPRPLSLLGANALTAWVLQYVLVFYPVTYAVSPPDFSVAANLGMVLVVTAALMATTLALARRGIRLPI
jgi:predicted acyltransferase